MGLDRRYDLTACVPFSSFLSDMKSDPNPSSTARKQWIKWKSTLVNRWKKNGVALYTPSEVRLIVWANPEARATWAPFLPSALPLRSSSRESCLTADEPAALVGDMFGHDGGSSWSGFASSPARESQSNSLECYQLRWISSLLIRPSYRRRLPDLCPSFQRHLTPACWTLPHLDHTLNQLLRTCCKPLCKT